jgi:hypothetical protein
MIEEFKKTSLSGFIDYNDPIIHEYADNLYEKMRQVGELASYIERDKVVREFIDVVDNSVTPMVVNNDFTFGVAYQGGILINESATVDNLGTNYVVEFEVMFDTLDFGKVYLFDDHIFIDSNNVTLPYIHDVYNPALTTITFALKAHGQVFHLNQLTINKLYKFKIVRNHLTVDVWLNGVFVIRRTLASDVDTDFTTLYEIVLPS